MIILGIDPGYGRLGYAILKKSNNKEKLLDYSCIETSPKKKHGERILEITEAIEKIIKKHKPNAMAIEKLFFTANQKTAMAVSEIRGIMIYIALKEGLQISEFTPLEIKSSICGYGKATKEQVKKMVDIIAKPNPQPKHDDTYDAIAVCLTCSAQSQLNKIC